MTEAKLQLENITPEIVVQNIRTLIQELQSGRWRRTTNQLAYRDEDFGMACYCCLGVAMKLSGYNEDEAHDFKFIIPTQHGPIAYHTLPSGNVLEALGLEFRHPSGGVKSFVNHDRHQTWTDFITRENDEHEEELHWETGSVVKALEQLAAIWEKSPPTQ